MKSEYQMLTERLVKHHPQIWRDLVAGKYQSVYQAAVVAGIQKPRVGYLPKGEKPVKGKKS